MGVTVFNDKYVRVTRAWNKEETQIYVPIKKSLKAALKEAEKIDRQLLEQQKAYLQEQELSGDRYFHEDGTIVGLRVVTRHRDGRRPSNEITLRIKVPNRNKPFFSNVSIDKHGFEQAFTLAVEKICEWNKLDKSSPVRVKMLGSLALHQKSLGGSTARSPAKLRLVSSKAAPQKSGAPKVSAPAKKAAAKPAARKVAAKKTASKATSVKAVATQAKVTKGKAAKAKANASAAKKPAKSTKVSSAKPSAAKLTKAQPAAKKPSTKKPAKAKGATSKAKASKPKTVAKLANKTSVSATATAAKKPAAKKK
ncbi:hypothetical protein HDN1F_05310 [gamma proteobacterium HdN1]|nr:hypothetical protein HDN1F_05310 [gamma proteobacterium HdN1]